MANLGRVAGRPPVVAVLLALAALTAALAGCGGGDPTAAAEQCEPVEPTWPDTTYNAPRQIVQRGDRLVAMVGTSCGAFRIALDTGRAPKTVNSFAALARKGFYEELLFDRIEPGRLIEGGDPPGRGIRGPGFSTREKPPADTTYDRWTVAMSKPPASPPGTSRSEFFIVVGPDARLPPEYALIGKVDRGFDVVRRIGELGTPSGRPTQEVMIEWIWAKKPTREEERTSKVLVPPFAVRDG